jgi:sugar phosphate isomerase/epimerase
LYIKQAYKAFTEPEKYIEVMGEKLVNLHINDRDEKHLCLLPGKGKVDYKSIFSKLNNIGYKGISIIEVYRDNFSGYNELMEAKEYLSKLI